MIISKIKNELCKQKSEKLKDNLYYFTQINFSYNSNHLEGSHLTKEQTEAIYNKSKDISLKDVNIQDDIKEAQNHFKLFDYILDNIDNKLSSDMILEMHNILKSNTSDIESAGRFKTLPNVIGMIDVVKTTKPEDVYKEIHDLLKVYNNLSEISFEDIVDFHVKFELIHPFNDGNGRIGRIIMFKECLKNNIMPFIIFEEDKMYYLRGLKNYQSDKMFLLDTCRYSQDIYEKVCKLLISDK